MRAGRAEVLTRPHSAVPETSGVTTPGGELGEQAEQGEQGSTRPRRATTTTTSSGSKDREATTRGSVDVDTWTPVSLVGWRLTLRDATRSAILACPEAPSAGPLPNHCQATLLRRVAPARPTPSLLVASRASRFSLESDETVVSLQVFRLRAQVSSTELSSEPSTVLEPVTESPGSPANPAGPASSPRPAGTTGHPTNKPTAPPAPPASVDTLIVARKDEKPAEELLAKTEKVATAAPEQPTQGAGQDGAEKVRTGPAMALS